MSYLRGYLGASNTKPRNSSTILSTNHCNYLQQILSTYGSKRIISTHGYWADGHLELMTCLGLVADRCLALDRDANRRPSAKDLSKHSWLSDGDWSFSVASLPDFLDVVFVYGVSEVGRNPISSWKGKNSWKIIDFSLDSFPATGAFNSTVWTDVFYVRERYLQETNSISWFYPKLFGEMIQIGELIFEIGLHKVVLDDHTNLSQHWWNYPPKSSVKSKKWLYNSFWKRML